MLGALTALALLAPASIAHAATILPDPGSTEYHVFGTWNTAGDGSGAEQDFSSIDVYFYMHDIDADDVWVVDAYENNGSSLTWNDAYVGGAFQNALFTPGGVHLEIAGVGKDGDGYWHGTFDFRRPQPEASRVPETGGTLTLLGCGLALLGGVRRVLAQRQRA